MSIEPIALSKVIADVYDAAINPSLWQKALGSACAFVGGSSAALFWHDAATERSQALHMFNDDPHYTKLYFEKYLPMNPVFPAATFMEPGVVHRPSDIVPEHELVTTRFYKEWIAPQGIVDGVGVSLQKGTTRASVLNIRMDTTCEPVNADTLHRMRLLVPHFQRAVAIGRLFDQSTAVQQNMTETLNHIEAAVFLVDGAGLIVFANASAHAMLRTGELVHNRDGRLSVAIAETDRKLCEIFAAAEDGDKSVGIRGVEVPLSETPAGNWFAHVLPLTSGSREGTGKLYAAIAAVFVRKTAHDYPSPLEHLSLRFKLTAGEVRVLDAVLRAGNIRTMAELLGISQATVKTHLQNLFRKTGAQRQGELVKLVTGLFEPPD